jgi:hypothetical protein
MDMKISFRPVLDETRPLDEFTPFIQHVGWANRHINITQGGKKILIHPWSGGLSNTDVPGTDAMGRECDFPAMLDETRPLDEFTPFIQIGKRMGVSSNLHRGNEIE